MKCLISLLREKYCDTYFWRILIVWVMTGDVRMSETVRSEVASCGWSGIVLYHRTEIQMSIMYISSLPFSFLNCMYDYCIFTP